MIKNHLAKRSDALPVSTIGKLLKIAETDKTILSLGPGEPDFASPPNVIRAAKNALTNKHTHYSPPGGRDDLKEAIVKKLKKENNIKVDLDNIIVTTGSTEGLLLSMMCTLDAGEGMMIPDPGFLAYKPAVEILNGIPISYKLMEIDEFQITTESLEQSILPERTRAIILNSPSNPTGTVISKKILEEIADFVIEHDLIVLSDEAYEKFVYEGKHISPASLNGMSDRVITLHSFSKSYAMPGFRIGYAVGPEELINVMKKVHVFTTICAPTISQIAALEALRGPKTYMNKMIADYSKRRLYMHKRLNDMTGVICIKPHGAFYAFPNIKYFGKKSVDFTDWVLKRAKVAVMPGPEFGYGGEGFVRCSYATSMKTIEKALNKMEALFSK